MSEQGTTDFPSRYGRWAVIAGASDGIGECFARGIARRGVSVVLLARRAAVLEELARSIEAEHGVDTRVVVADLTSGDLLETVSAGTEGLEVGLLVYNAGAVHGARRLLEHPVERALELVDLNCRGPLLLAHHFGSAMRERRRGGIVLLSSMAALAGSSFTAPYNATKSFDLILAEGLWHELAPDGIDVLAALVGATRTPSMLASNPAFEDFPSLMEPVDVAEGALQALGQGPVWVAGDHNRALAHSLLPVSRVGIVNAMSRATAELYRLPFSEVAGRDFREL